MLHIKHIETDSLGEFTAWLDDQQAGEMTYTRPNPDTMVINHTQTFSGFEGQGIARQMVLAAVDFARTNHRHITPLCSYALAVLTRTNDYQDVLTNNSSS